MKKFALVSAFLLLPCIAGSEPSMTSKYTVGSVVIHQDHYFVTGTMQITIAGTTYPSQVQVEVPISETARAFIDSELMAGLSSTYPESEIELVPQ